MIIKYRKKPVIIEAVEYTPENKHLAVNFCHGQITNDKVSDDDNDVTEYIRIDTLEGSMLASVGDYIIKGVQGEFYPCKPDIFHATYDIMTAKPSDTDKALEKILYKLLALAPGEVTELDSDIDTAITAIKRLMTEDGQGEKRALLERLKAKQGTCYDCTHDDIPSGETVNFIDVSAIDAELRLLDGGTESKG